MRQETNAHRPRWRRNGLRGLLVAAVAGTDTAIRLLRLRLRRLLALVPRWACPRTSASTGWRWSSAATTGRSTCATRARGQASTRTP